MWMGLYVLFSFLTASQEILGQPQSNDQTVRKFRSELKTGTSSVHPTCCEPKGWGRLVRILCMPTPARTEAAQG